jgi:hypothetical protein
MSLTIFLLLVLGLACVGGLVGRARAGRFAGTGASAQSATYQP